MASREMIDVLQRLRELDEKNPNIVKDAVENTEKMNPPVEEAKKKMVKDPKTGKMVPDYAIDGKGKDDLKKEEVKESITISADSPEDLPMLQQIMKLAGMQAVTPDMMPDGDNVPAMKADDSINGSPCGCDDEDNAIITKTDKGVDFDLDRDGAPDMTYDNSPREQYKGVADVTTQTGYGDANGPKHPQDIRVKDPTPYGDFEARLAKLAGIESEQVEDEETDEGYANSMGDEKEDPTYKGYDPDYADHTEDGKPKVRYVPAGSADNPLESIENNLRSEYETFKEELWNQLSDGKETTSEGRGKVMAGRGRGKLMAGRGKVMASRGRGKMPKEDVKTTEGRGRGKGKK